MRDMPPTDQVSRDGIEPAGLMGMDDGTSLMVRIRATAGGALVTSGPATVADGADVTQGAIADAAVTTNADGTVSAKLRGLIALTLAWARGGGATTAQTLRVTQGASTAGGQGSKNVVTAGVPLALAATTAITSVAITARIGNTKEIAVGFSNAVRATAGSEIGMQVQPGASVVMAVSDLAGVWIDAQVSGEGVSFTYTTD